MRVRLASEPAPDRVENEDAIFRCGPLVGVLDGVSVPRGVETGCVHGVAWYVQRLVHHLGELTPVDGLVDGLASAIDAVRGEHDGRCDLDHPNTPAATVAMVRVADACLEYLVLCEAYVVLDSGRIDVITDDRFRAVVADIRQAALTGAAAIGAGDHEAMVRRVALTRQQRTNRADGYWIAAATPEAAHQAVTGWRPLTGSNRISRGALLTDGASCAVDLFRLFNWSGLLNFVTEHGPEELIRQVRIAEDADPTGYDRPRYKRHDDASIALCLFEEDQ